VVSSKKKIFFQQGVKIHSIPIIVGDRIVNTPYDVAMGVNVNCKLLCNTKNLPLNWDIQQSKKVVERIEHEYYVHLIVDNLPVATRIKNPDTMEVQFEHGYRLGMVKKGEPYINNHLKFILSYHMHSK
jgi:transmembrane 9 superfamily member 2/4